MCVDLDDVCENGGVKEPKADTARDPRVENDVLGERLDEGQRRVGSHGPEDGEDGGEDVAEPEDRDDEARVGASQEHGENTDVGRGLVLKRGPAAGRESRHLFQPALVETLGEGKRDVDNRAAGPRKLADQPGSLVPGARGNRLHEAERSHPGRPAPQRGEDDLEVVREERGCHKGRGGCNTRLQVGPQQRLGRRRPLCILLVLGPNKHKVGKDVELQRNHLPEALSVPLGSNLQRQLKQLKHLPRL